VDYSLFILVVAMMMFMEAEEQPQAIMVAFLLSIFT
jgi:hypothetical protein